MPSTKATIAYRSADPSSAPSIAKNRKSLAPTKPGTRRSVATAAERSRLRSSARTTQTKDQRINIRLTREDLGA